MWEASNYLFILLILANITLAGAETKDQAYQHVKVTFFSGKGQFSFDAEVARNQEQFTLGLMHRPQLGKDKGMLFVFPDSEERYFWMKNTLIPLDIIFISESHRVVNIALQAQPCPQMPCPTYNSSQPVKYVLEVNGGLSREMGLKVGDKVNFDLK